MMLLLKSLFPWLCAYIHAIVPKVVIFCFHNQICASRSSDDNVFVEDDCVRGGGGGGNVAGIEDGQGLRLVPVVGFQPRVAVGVRGERRHTVRPLRAQEDPRARRADGRRTGVRLHAQVHQNGRAVDAGLVPPGRDGLRAGHPRVPGLPELRAVVPGRRQRDSGGGVHLERGGRVHRRRHAVGAGHRDGGRAGQEAVAARTAAADRRRPGRGPRDLGGRPVAGHRPQQRAPAPGGPAHVVRPPVRVRGRRDRPRDYRVRRGRGPAARDPAAGDRVRGPPPARRAAPDGRRPGRQELRVLHVPAERHRVRAGHVVPRERASRLRGRGGRETGGHGRAGHGPRH